ncbi:hypothetical protein BIV57_17970 [Mangrovactinospora gilvigrisea]|uniref:Uncharacterized protein n=1 Tax=Mangrovactinospora gilvigrisea TaxID=1428644 RepID=A0A1J7BC08_9ACTN|nr:hypothetical protein [Mangrovactinospora gilvigrisea]OIV36125.1 hypothetical protein BIV57_17970 [Mangrovactinospora gilvigrisea]
MPNAATLPGIAAALAELRTTATDPQSPDIAPGILVLLPSPTRLDINPVHGQHTYSILDAGSSLVLHRDGRPFTSRLTKAATTDRDAATHFLRVANL